MRNLAKRLLLQFLALIGVPGDIQLLFTLVSGSGLIGIIIGWLAWAQEEPYWAILIGLGCAAFTLNIAIAIVVLWRLFRVYESLVVENIEAFGASINRSTKLLNMPFKVTLRNPLNRSVAVNFRRFETVLQGRTNKGAKQHLTSGVVPPRGTLSFKMESVGNLDTSKEISGSIEIEIEYGANADRLPYLHRYVFNIAIMFPSGLDYQSGDNSVETKLVPMLMEEKHYKKEWL